jgi:hypothetical protein
MAARTVSRSPWGGNRFRTDGTPGKVYDHFHLHFEKDEEKPAN